MDNQIEQLKWWQWAIMIFIGAWIIGSFIYFLVYTVPELITQGYDPYDATSSEIQYGF